MKKILLSTLLIIIFILSCNKMKELDERTKNNMNKVLIKAVQSGNLAKTKSLIQKAAPIKFDYL